MLVSRRPPLVAAASLLALSATGCEGAHTTATPTTARAAADTSTLATATTPAATSPSASDGQTRASASPSSSKTSGPQRHSSSCSTQTAAEAAAKLEPTLPQYMEGWVWKAPGRDNQYDPCSELSYITMGLDLQTADSPYHVGLYHHGAYIGTATKDFYNYHPDVTRTAENAIQVRYNYHKDGDCPSCATGHTVATFRWDDAAKRVVMTGSVPPPQ